MLSPRQGSASHRWTLRVILALAPLWIIGILARGLWTPDEPREADIAWRMSHQADRTLPELAGTPFLEKPPLTYWMSAGGLRLFGESPDAARAPNILYAVLTALAIGALAFAMEGSTVAAVVAALVAGSAITAFRVAAWLAPDACLLAGCAIALLGAYLGYTAPTGRRKLLGYCLLHAGAALGFMAKSAPGWIVPALALLTLVAWERRWTELRRWELYAGFGLQVLIIGPWILAVLQADHGNDALSALFWHNIVGRFTKIAAPAALDYSSGHRNTPGKYFIELPVYLLPWTLLAAAALWRAWNRVRVPGPAGTPWRFAIGATLPFLVLLSVAATARDIYAAPALLGFGVLIALWLDEARRVPTRIDEFAIRWTRWLVAFIALAFAAVLGVLTAATPGVTSVAAAITVLVAAFISSRSSAQAQAEGDLYRSFAWTYGSYASALCITALALFPSIDRSHDLPQLAQRIHSDSAHHELALLAPDETTIAMLDYRLHTPFTILLTAGDTPGRVTTQWFNSHGGDARILVLLPGHASGELTRLLGRIRLVKAPDDGTAGVLAAAGVASVVGRYELPEGRRYALLGPPTPATR